MDLDALHERRGGSRQLTSGCGDGRLAAGGTRMDVGGFERAPVDVLVPGKTAAPRRRRGNGRLGAGDGQDEKERERDCESDETCADRAPTHAAARVRAPGGRCGPTPPEYSRAGSTARADTRAS